MGRLSPGTCRCAVRGSGPASLIAPVRLAQAGLNGPARLATVPGAVAAGAIEHGFAGVSGSTVIGGRWGAGVWGGAVWGGAIIGPRGVIGIRTDAEIEGLRRCCAGAGDQRRERNCRDLGHSCLPLGEATTHVGVPSSTGAPAAAAAGHRITR